jgi:hypothetical protein
MTVETVVYQAELLVLDMLDAAVFESVQQLLYELPVESGIGEGQYAAPIS